MSSMGYVTIIGRDQGRIEGGGGRDTTAAGGKGGADSKGQGGGKGEGLIEIVSFDHAVELPRRGSASVAAGRALHKDIEVAKLIDRATPKLYQALIQGEILTEVLFEWYQHTGKGEPELAYSVQLKNALLTRVQPWMPDFLNPDQDRYRFMEKIAFSYETILWSWGRSGDLQFEASWAGGDKGDKA